MSLFKIVGNYYEDILDYFTREYKKFDTGFDPKALEREYLKYQDDPSKSAVLVTFATNFKKIFDLPPEKATKKTDIIKLLAKTNMRLDRLQQADWKYWESRKNTYSGMLAILIIMMLIILIIVILLALKSVEFETDNYKKTKGILAYGIIYLIVFTVMLTFVMNMSENAKMSEERGKGNRDQFTNFHLILVPNMQINLFFTMLGYAITNATDSFNRVKKTLEKTQKQNAKGAKGKCKDTITTKIVDYIEMKDPCTNKMNFNEIYDKFKNDIVSYIFQFYNYGYGYTTVKRAVVKSNSSFILREVRKVLSFYYYLMNRKGVENEKANIENDQRILDKVLIDKLDDMKIADFLKPDGSAADIQTAAKENEQNPDFLKELKRWMDAINYLAVFVYPLYLNENPLSANFMVRSAATHFPMNLDDTNGDMFVSDTRQYFIVKYQTRYKDMLAMRANATGAEINVVMSEFMNDCRSYITTAFNKLILASRGTTMFALDDAFIKSKLAQMNKAAPLALLDGNYRDAFNDAFTSYLMPKVRDDIYADLGSNEGQTSVASLINYKVGLIVEGLALDLSAYNMNITENSNYILNKLMDKADNPDKRLLEIYNSILKKLDGAIEIKKRMQRKDDKTNPQFVNSAEFTKRIDDMLFEDLYQGMESFYLYEILNDFYMEVSSTIGSGTNRTEHNIFYAKERKMKIAQMLVAMVSIIMFTCFGHYLIGWIKSFKELKEAGKSVKLENNNDEAKAEYKVKKAILRTKNVNAVVKILIPLAMVIFLVSMFNSYYKKAMYKFTFNKETIENNTSELLDSVSKLDTLLGAMRKDVNKNNYARIGDISVITDETKSELYDHITNIVKNYEKCNYILNISRSTLPFPYTEITVDAFMMFATVMCFLYVVGQMNPLGRLKKVKELNKRRDELAVLPDAEMAQILSVEKACNAVDLDNIVFALKIIVFSFIFMFLIFYTVTIVTSTSEFQAGLYNSGYFEESMCYTDS